MMSIVVTTLIATYIAAFVAEGIMLHRYFRRNGSSNETTANSK